MGKACKQKTYIENATMIFLFHDKRGLNFH